MVKNRNKTRKNGLTASREKRVRSSRANNRPASKAAVARLDALDGLRECCANLTTLAGLLDACGDHRRGEPLEREMVGNTGSLILREVRQVKAFLDGLEKAQ
jgi:hypothetical protein